MYTTQASDVLAMSADAEIFLAKFAGTALSLFLDEFLGLSNRVSSYHYGWHLAALIFFLIAVRGLWNDNDEAVKEDLELQSWDRTFRSKQLLCMRQYCLCRCALGDRVTTTTTNAQISIV
jgi:hypothetical protein